MQDNKNTTPESQPAKRGRGRPKKDNPLTPAERAAVLLRKSDNLIIHACPGACAARYSIRPERGVRDIAMPLLARARLNKLPSTRMKWTYQPTLLTPGIGITLTNSNVIIYRDYSYY